MRILYTVQNISRSVLHWITFFYYWVPDKNIPLSFQLRKFEWNKQNLNANFHKNYWLDVNNRLKTVTYRPQKILYYEALPTWGKASTILERTKKMQPKWEVFHWKGLTFPTMFTIEIYCWMLFGINADANWRSITPTRKLYNRLITFTFIHSFVRLKLTIEYNNTIFIFTKIYRISEHNCTGNS